MSKGLKKTLKMKVLREKFQKFHFNKILREKSWSFSVHGKLRETFLGGIYFSKLQFSLFTDPSETRFRASVTRRNKK